MVSMMSANDMFCLWMHRSFLAATALMPSFMPVMNLATLHWTGPIRFLLQEHCATKTDLIQGIDTPTTKGQIMLLLWSLTWEAFQQVTVLLPFLSQQKQQFRRHTSCSSSSHHSCWCQPLANGCPHHHSHHDINMHSHTPSHTHHFSHRHHSFHSIDQSWSCSSYSCHTTQETQPRKAKLHPRPSTPINFTIP